MPLLGLLHTLIALTFAVHAMRTGRPQYWMWIIILLPVLGSLAYIAVELMPELAQTRRARRIKGQIGDIVAPDREFHRRREQALMTGSVDAKRALAEECERKGMWADAMSLYRHAAQGVFRDDAGLNIGLARAQLGAGEPEAALRTLDALQQSNPDIHSAEGHLIYARALEALGRLDAAAGEYDQLVAYAVGLEPRARFGLLLLRLGKPHRARDLFEAVVRMGAARGAVLSDADRDWLKVAKSNL